jgi:hypothetical protein
VSETRAADAPPPPDLGRRTLSPFGYAVCIAVPFVIAAIGFAFLHVHYDKEDLVSGTKLQLLTSDWKAGDAALTDRVTGELTLEGGCVRLVGADGAQVDVVWPADYEATVQRVASRDQLKLYDTERHIAARGGDTVELGGGFDSADPYAGLACAPASDQVFLVQSKVTVTGRE